MRRSFRSGGRAIAVTLIAATFSVGCANLTPDVKPWERDLHARPDMQPDNLDVAIDEHIYFSKEASSGGRGFGGGGCGCN
ncbi:MAG: DUF4266 domain-containing protein [Steroidobacteraceae bacterium]|jgi:hypothetical protein|nr:DUF4266 domain-containing protein [Steroidobacteraceae bacterium]